MSTKHSKIEHISFSVPQMGVKTDAYVSEQSKAPWRLICIPGTPSHPYLFNRLLRLASNELEIVVINRLGFHKSHNSPVLNFNDQVRVVEPFLGGKRNIVLGISYGGALALTAALNYPDNIEGVITGAALISEPHNYTKVIMGSEIIKKFESLTPIKIKHMKAEIEGRREQIHPLLKRLYKLNAPVEVLHGTLDTLVPKNDAQILVKAIGDHANYQEIKGGTHYMEFQMPKRIIKTTNHLIVRIDAKISGPNTF